MWDDQREVIPHIVLFNGCTDYLEGSPTLTVLTIFSIWQPRYSVFSSSCKDTIDIGTVINGSSLLRMVISTFLTGATMFWGQDAVDNLCDVTRAVVWFCWWCCKFHPVAIKRINPGYRLKVMELILVISFILEWLKRIVYIRRIFLRAVCIILLNA